MSFKVGDKVRIRSDAFVWLIGSDKKGDEGVIVAEIWDGWTVKTNNNSEAFYIADELELIEETSGYVTKDSGQRSEYASGMVRDTENGKPRFDLILPLGIPFRDQMLTRFAELLARGAEKYADRNWEKAEGDEELSRYKSSAFRHFIQWMTDETDEDHAAAVMFNLLAAETVKVKMTQKGDTVESV